MSWWDDTTKPIDKVLDSNVFKAVMPVQALGQEAVKLGTGALGINNGQGLTPSTQYAIGAGIGATLAGGSALMGASSPGAGTGAGAGSAGATPANSASSWENHAPMNRSSYDDNQKRPQNIYEQRLAPKMPTMQPNTLPSSIY